MHQSLVYKFLFIVLCNSITLSQINDSLNMNTTFYRGSLENPIAPDVNSVSISSASNKTDLKDYQPDGESDYLFRYLNSRRNSRLNSELPASDVWEVKWTSPVKPDAAPWYLLIKNNRIILQDEYGWQLFGADGKKISEGVRAEGEIVISKSEDKFFVNDHSGYIQAFDLITGAPGFYVYPFLGKGFERTVIFTNGSRIINKAFELPVMTHDSGLQIPEVNIIEILNLGGKIDSDGVMKSSSLNENLILKTIRAVSAVNDKNIVIAVPDHIYMLDDKLKIIKDLTGNFIPLELSLDEEMRIYLLAQVRKDNEWKTEYWMMDSNGALICSKEIPSIDQNYIAPAAIDYQHNAYIMYPEKIISVTPAGEILWEEYIQKPLSGISAGNDQVLVCEGTYLTSFNHKGARKLIFNFNEELAAPAVLYNKEIFAVTRSNLYCLTPRK